MNGTEEPPEPGLPDELVIAFSEIVVGNNRVSSITLREPTGLQVRKAESEMKSGVNVETLRLYQFSLVSQVSGVPREIIERLPITKLNEASRYIQDFIELARKLAEPDRPGNPILRLGSAGCRGAAGLAAGVVE